MSRATETAAKEKDIRVVLRPLEIISTNCRGLRGQFNGERQRQRQLQRLIETLEACQAYKHFAVCLQEIGQEQMSNTVHDGTFLFLGQAVAVGNGGRKGTAGMGFALGTDGIQAWWDAGRKMNMNYPSKRVADCRLLVNNHNGQKSTFVHLVNAHAPTKSASMNAWRLFLQDMSDSVSSAEDVDTVIIAGDFNTSIGVADTNLSFDELSTVASGYSTLGGYQPLGQFGMPGRARRGALLLEWIREHRFVSVSSFFAKDYYATTMLGPRSLYQESHFLVQEKDAECVIDCGVDPGIELGDKNYASVKVVVDRVSLFCQGPDRPTSCRLCSGADGNPMAKNCSLTPAPVPICSRGLVLLLTDLHRNEASSLIGLPEGIMEMVLRCLVGQQVANSLLQVLPGVNRERRDCLAHAAAVATSQGGGTGETGSGDGDVNFAQGSTVLSSSGEVAVADCNNRRVCRPSTMRATTSGSPGAAALCNRVVLGKGSQGAGPATE
jgi:hypothetical protein